MPEIITVKEVAPPKPGGKQGTVTDTQDRKWKVWGDKLQFYQVGAQYNIISTKSTLFNGQTYVTIDKMEPVGAQRPLPIQAPPPPPTSYQPPVHQPMAIPAAQQSDRARRMDIFVCGAFNNMMANQNINPLALQLTDVVALLNMLIEAWGHTLGSAQQPSADMGGDRVPF